MVTLVFMLERNILSRFFLSQLIEHFHRIQKEKQLENGLNMTSSYPNP